MIFKRFIFSVSLLSLSVLGAMAQQSLDAQQSERLFEEAMQQYQMEHYGVARQMFEQLQLSIPRGKSNLDSEAAFYEALSASRLGNEDAKELLERFLVEFPESGKRPYVFFQLGELAQEDENYRQAARWYDKVEVRKLDRDTRLDYRFKYGYAHFMEGNYDKALSAFSEVRNVQSKWWSSANYYYAHIQYEQGNYQVALETFEKLKKETGFEKVVPFYIAQIYYMQGEYQKAIDYGMPLFEEAKGERKAAMAQVLGNAWFALKDYSNAARYLSVAVETAKEPGRDDFYHLGLSYYFLKDYEKASSYLAQVTGKEDAMSQNAYYHLGDCYLKLDDKKRARIAFEAASQYDFDAVVTEDAMFTYIKLNYDLSFSPFNEIINSFLTFIDKFPKSRHIDEAYDYLGQALLTSRNYKEALAALERVKNKSANSYKALQRIAYYRGLELFTNLQFGEAIEMLDYSLKYGDYDRDLKMKAHYWLGEAWYRQGNYPNAISHYTTFIHLPGSFKTDEFKTAHYNLGYACFKQLDYPQAASWFRKYVNLMKGTQNAMVGDALNRVGDAFFMERDFPTAIEYYNQAAQVPGASPDYAMFQKGFAMGIAKDHAGKIAQLQKLINRFPESQYVDDALFEMGRSYVALNNLDQAIRTYKTIKEDYPRSSYAKKAMLQLGLVYYNNNDLEQSLSFYKRVVNEFPGSAEAEDALLGIRNIYIDRNDADGYIAYTNQLGGFARVDQRQQDSLTYVAAERLYMQGKCLQAINQFEAYLRNYPKGRFELNAHYYKADCQYQNQDYENALPSFEYVAGSPRNLFTEDALIRVAEISFRQKRFDDALGYFERLYSEAEVDENRREALIGQMRCLSELGDPDKIIASTEKVMADAKMSPEIVRQAHYLKASAFMAQGKSQQALFEFQVLAKNTASPEGAEARFRVAQILFQQGKMEGAEEAIFDFVDKGTPHQYWLAKCFLLLADIYEGRGELFQARQYLESLLENYQDQTDGIRESATAKLEQIKAKSGAEKP